MLLFVSASKVFREISKKLTADACTLHNVKILKGNVCLLNIAVFMTNGATTAAADASLSEAQV
jgi:hypothetical protein